MKIKWNQLTLAFLLFAAVIAGSAMVLQGCEKKGPMEKTGKAIDNAAKDTGKAVENAGEKVKDAVKK
jgi:hypothetical protein